MADKSALLKIKNEKGNVEIKSMHVPLSDEEYYMAFRLSELDKVSIPEEVGKLIQAEYNRRQYKELQNHGQK